jgi:hypothetical protein
MPAPASVKRSKSHLAITMLLIGAALVGGPYALASANLMQPLKAYGWVVLLVAYVGILLKACIGYLTTRDFRYDKTAYDLSVLVFGGTLTCLALQIVTATVLFPGLQNIPFLSFASAFGVDVRGQHIALLLLLLLSSLVATILSAMGVADTESEKPNWWWTLGCSFIAYVLVGAYALTLIAKG